MQFDLRRLAPRDRYKLLVSVVVPRPIALVTSLNAEGHLNAAPFSFFNMMGSDPPLVVLGIGDRDPDTPKDTAGNIRQSGAFVVNIVDEPLAAKMNICAVDFPSGISEIEAAGLTTAPSTQIPTPRIVESPVNLECHHHSTVEIGHTRIIIGEVLHYHIRDELIDAEKLYIKTEQLRPIARMHGAGWYARTTDLFPMPRMSYAEWQTKQEEG